jgi:hypothetical protein
MSANEEYMIQGLDVAVRGIAELQEQVQDLQREIEDAQVPAVVSVAMESLKILSRSQKLITRSTTERRSGVDSSDNEMPTEMIHRYPRQLEESEADLRDICCQLISGYLLQAIDTGPSDTV